MKALNNVYLWTSHRYWTKLHYYDDDNGKLLCGANLEALAAGAFEKSDDPAIPPPDEYPGGCKKCHEAYKRRQRKIKTRMKTLLEIFKNEPDKKDTEIQLTPPYE